MPEENIIRQSCSRCNPVDHFFSSFGSTKGLKRSLLLDMAVSRSSWDIEPCDPGRSARFSWILGSKVTDGL